MSPLESERRQRLLKAHLARSLLKRFWVRIHASLIMLGAVVAGWLADWILLRNGLGSMLFRFPIAVLVAYLAFLIGARFWIDYSGISKYFDEKGAQELLGFPDTGALGVRPSAEGASRDTRWDEWSYWLAWFAEPIVWLLLAAAAVSVVALLLYGAGFYLIAEAEGFFTEIVFELLLAAGLVRGMRKTESRGWISGFVSVTWPALFIVMSLSLGVAAFAEYRYPGTKTMAELLNKMSGGSNRTLGPR